MAVSIRPVEAPPRRDLVTAVRPAAASALSLAKRAMPGSAAAPGPASLAPQPAMAEVRPAELNVDRESSPGTEPEPEPEPKPPAPAPRGSVEPLDAERSRLHVTVSQGFLEKLEAAKNALSHSMPGASMEEILEAGLDLVLDRHAKRKGLVAKPRKEVPPAPARTETVPSHVKRAVWARAGGRCEWVLESGERCGCTVRLEFDHILPVALGGRSTIENVRLACRPHNDAAARLVFGDGWMNRFTRKRGRIGRAQAGAP